MSKAFGIALLVVGFGLIAYGIAAANSVTSDVARTFTGMPTDKTLWLLLGGIAAITLGSLMTFGAAGKAPK